MFALQEAVAVDTVMRSLPRWDSLKHLMLMVEIEKKFGVEITPQDIQSVTTVGDIIAIVTNKKK